LCEIISSAAEGHAAARAAYRTGKPVWVAWTLHEDRSGNLRSEENVAEAVAAPQGLPVSGFLANCSAAESIGTICPNWPKRVPIGLTNANKCRLRMDND